MKFPKVNNFSGNWMAASGGNFFNSHCLFHAILKTEKYLLRIKSIEITEQDWRELDFFFHLNVHTCKSRCPGFGQDRVNFSPEARRGHSQAGWPNLAKQNRIFDTMCRLAGCQLGSWPGKDGRGLGVHGAPGGKICSGDFSVCFVYSPYQYCCCYCSLHLLFC